MKLLVLAIVSPVAQLASAASLVLVGAASYLGAIDVNVDATMVVAVGTTLVGVIAAMRQMRTAGTRQATELALLRGRVKMLEAILKANGLVIPDAVDIDEIFKEQDPK